jgi:hypothetical protein
MNIIILSADNYRLLEDHHVHICHNTEPRNLTCTIMRLIPFKCLVFHLVITQVHEKEEKSIMTLLSSKFACLVVCELIRQAEVKSEIVTK